MRVQTCQSLLQANNQELVAGLAQEPDCLPPLLEAMAATGKVDRLLELRPRLPPSAAIRAFFGGLLSPMNLELRRIQWETTAAHDLQVIAQREVIHGIRTVGQIRQRLGVNRRCFAWYHAALPHQPLVILHVALLADWPTSLVGLLTADPREAELKEPKLACFYSIANGPAGVSGLGLAEALLKAVLPRVQTEFPSLQHTVTMSPIPTFKLSLEQASVEKASSEKASLDNSPAGLREMAARVEAHLAAKRGSHLLDPVAHFHLRNGASLGRLLYMPDAPSYIRQQSAGFMAHYRYEAKRLEERAQKYAQDGNLCKDPGYEVVIAS